MHGNIYVIVIARGQGFMAVYVTINPWQPVLQLLYDPPDWFFCLLLLCMLVNTIATASHKQNGSRRSDGLQFRSLLSWHV